MQKIKIIAPEAIAIKLLDKLRNSYDTDIEISNEMTCEIQAMIKRKWTTICSFSADENFHDILTMFKVNYQIKRGQRYPI
jgi:hypothetical protein